MQAYRRGNQLPGLGKRSQYRQPTGGGEESPAPGPLGGITEGNTTMRPKIDKRLAPYRIEPGCDEGGHTRYWIGCNYCDRNKRQHQFHSSRPGRQR